MNRIILLLSVITLAANINAQESVNSQDIIDRAIQAHGGKDYKEARYTYQFRDHVYTYIRSGGTFQYERYHPTKKTKDVLTNDGLKRYVDDKEAAVSDKMRGKYAESVNSVSYFAFLPYFLNDPAVNHRSIGETSIKGEPYHMIEVTFDQEGGGKDHDDVYVYWIHQKNFTVDYLAYSFHVNGGGVRFRSAYNRRTVDGIVFQDYVNYKHNKNTKVSKLGELYDSGQLQELSKIELKDIKSIKS